MKKKVFVIINWRTDFPSGMYRVAAKVVQSMTDNENFPTPDVPMKDYETAASRLNSAISNRDNGKSAQLELKNAAQDMDVMMRNQATYVTEAAKNSQLIVESSGYQSNVTNPKKKSVPDMPTNMKVKSENGNIVLSAKKPKGSATLCWLVFINTAPVDVQVTNLGIKLPDNAAGVMIIPAGNARIVLDGLPIGTKVTAQVLAQNAAGKSPLTPTAFAVINKQ